VRVAIPAGSLMVMAGPPVELTWLVPT
jgi:hypothetical protein